MLRAIDENRLSGARLNSVKVRIFRGATIDNMKDFLKLYLKRSPTNIILYVDTNNSINDPSSQQVSSSVILNCKCNPLQHNRQIKQWYSSVENIKF